MVFGGLAGSMAASIQSVEKFPLARERQNFLAYSGPAATNVAEGQGTVHSLHGKIRAFRPLALYRGLDHVDTHITRHVLENPPRFRKPFDSSAVYDCTVHI